MKSVRCLMFLFAVALSLCARRSGAQVPQIISFQGLVSVSGTNFNGAGLFRFALVNGAGTVSFWSNDGTSAAGSQPATAVAVGVTNGLYTVLLGDPLAGMAPIPIAVFTNSDVRLRTWFNDGIQGVMLLTPDERVAAVGYAIMAGTAAVATTVPDGTITGAKLAGGAVGAAQLAPGAAAASLQAGGQSPVASGGIILSTNGAAANLLSAGYIRIGTAAVGDVWESQTNGPPAPRAFHTAVWTGSEMIIWGGLNSNSVALSDGARFNPVANTWTVISATGAPGPRYDHMSVWTGTEMLIWGGQNTFASTFNDGARYNPAANTWAAMTQTGVPASRSSATAVWTGTEMIVWGGAGGAASALNTGARYNPSANTWTAIPLPNPATFRVFHSAVWSGSEMIIWGGTDGTSFLNTGSRYSPVTNTWVPTATTGVGVPSGRDDHTAVWTGSQMLVWGGQNAGGPLGDGSAYNPSSNSWSSLTAVSAPNARLFHTAVWSGIEMIVWGGQTNVAQFNDGGRYNPAVNTWNPLSTAGAPVARLGHTALWTSVGMLIWGGRDGPNFFNDAGTYSPPSTVYLYLQP